MDRLSRFPHLEALVTSPFALIVIVITSLSPTHSSTSIHCIFTTKSLTPSAFPPPLLIPIRSRPISASGFLSWQSNFFRGVTANHCPANNFSWIVMSCLWSRLLKSSRMQNLLFRCPRSWLNGFVQFTQFDRLGLGTPDTISHPPVLLPLLPVNTDVNRQLREDINTIYRVAPFQSQPTVVLVLVLGGEISKQLRLLDCCEWQECPRLGPPCNRHLPIPGRRGLRLLNTWFASELVTARLRRERALLLIRLFFRRRALYIRRFRRRCRYVVFAISNETASGSREG